MQKDILSVINHEDIDIMDHYHSLSPAQQEHTKSVADLAVKLLFWAVEDGLVSEQQLPVKDLYKAILFHDIGFVLIPERVLDKTEDLTSAEKRVIEKHTIYGGTLIDNYRKTHAQTPEDHYFWKFASEIALCHHERWDGKGYPYGQSTTAIPFAARAVSIADAYDSIIRGAHFRMALPSEYAVLEILYNAGRQFDSQLAEIFRTHML